jgi:hypothetical protein
MSAELEGTVALELRLGVRLGTARVEEFEDGTGVPLLEGIVPLRLGLSVALGNTVTVVFTKGSASAVLSATGADGLGMGNGLRGSSVFVPTEPEDTGTVLLKLGLGVALGRTMMVVFAKGSALLLASSGADELGLGVAIGSTTTIVVFAKGSAMLLNSAGADELGMGNGLRGSSVFVPIDTVLIVAFMLGLGVMLGSTTTIVVFTKGSTLLLTSTGADELGIGNGERGESEFVPIEAVLIVLFMVGLGVSTGSTTTIVVFAKGSTMLLASIGADELGIGNGERGESEFVPIETVPIGAVLIVLFMFGLGVSTGSTTTIVVFTKGSALLSTAGTDELGMGNGERGESEFVPIETVLIGAVLIVLFMLGLGVSTGSTTTIVVFTKGSALLSTAGTRELGMGNGERGESEFVPIESVLIEAVLIVTFMLGLGVTLGSTTTTTATVVFVTGSTELSTAGDDELGMGNGERGESEFVPVESVLIEAVLIVTFMLGLGVALGGTTTTTAIVVFVNGRALLSIAGIDELEMGNGKRGESEFVPVEPVLIVTAVLGLGTVPKVTVRVEFADGTIDALGGTELAEELGIGKGLRGESEFDPVKPVEIGVVGVDARLGELAVELTISGGISPSPPVEDATAVDPEVEENELPDDTVTFGGDAGAAKLSGGISPIPPVEVAIAVEPEVEKMRLPDDTVTFNDATGIELGGGISPSPPVEERTAVDPEVEKNELLDDTVTLVGGDTGAAELNGGISPFPPVEVATAVELEVAKMALPTLVPTTRRGDGVPTCEL